MGRLRGCAREEDRARFGMTRISVSPVHRVNAHVLWSRNARDLCLNEYAVYFIHHMRPLNRRETHGTRNFRHHPICPRAVSDRATCGLMLDVLRWQRPAERCREVHLPDTTSPFLHTHLFPDPARAGRHKSVPGGRSGGAPHWHALNAVDLGEAHAGARLERAHVLRAAGERRLERLPRESGGTNEWRWPGARGLLGARLAWGLPGTHALGRSWESAFCKLRSQSHIGAMD